MDDFEKELKVGFLEEALAGLEEVEQSFLLLETDPNDSSTLDKIFRLAHNLKGSSKAVGFDEIGLFTHEFESLLLKLKNKELPVLPGTVNLLLRCNDHVLSMIHGLRQDLNARFDSALLLQEIADVKEGRISFSDSTVAQTTEAPTSEDDFENLQQEYEKALQEEREQRARPAEASQSVSCNASESLASVPIIDDVSSSMIEVPSADQFQEDVTFSNKSSQVPEVQIAKAVQTLQQATAPQRKGTDNPNKAQDESIRVGLQKLEKLINFVGEMVILQAVLNEQARGSQNNLLTKTVSQMSKVVREVQDLSMSLRMVPIKTTFQKMNRIVRDTAQALGKDVSLELIGEETELDKTVLEKINDPLVHLIRNAVDHGVEMPDVRAQTGKSTRGTVRLAAAHEAGKLTITISDDGGGIDGERLRNKAIKNGLIKENQTLTEQEALNLVFAPGLSTKEVVTDVSGRGVGMDVVKTNIQDLSGDIQIRSEKGRGTIFKITLPLTLAVIDGMVVTVGDERFVIPLSHVHETVGLSTSVIKETVGLGDLLLLRGENLSLQSLGKLFLRKTTKPKSAGIALVVRTSETPFALWVDEIVGQYQVVIKQLGSELQNIRGVVGSTILGDGKPALIIEPAELIKLLGGGHHRDFENRRAI